MAPVGLHRVGIPALMVGSISPGDWFWRMVSRDTRFVMCRGEHDSPLSLKIALDALRKGKVVTMAVDGRSGNLGLQVPFLGRMTRVAKGITVLARLSGAPILPALATWSGGDWSVDFRLHNPLPLPDRGSMAAEAWENEALVATVKFFEAIVREHPGQFRIDRVARLYKFPRIRKAAASVSASVT
jgi:lauroyl/myristoyl acyltransferase